jgi:hypothetical protein
MDRTGSRSIPASEVEKDFDRYQSEADAGPILISRDGLPRTVLMSYDEFMRLKRHDRNVYDLDDLPPHLVSAIMDAEAPEELGEDAEPASMRS